MRTLAPTLFVNGLAAVGGTRAPTVRDREVAAPGQALRRAGLGAHRNGR